MASPTRKCRLNSADSGKITLVPIKRIWRGWPIAGATEAQHAMTTNKDLQIRPFYEQSTAMAAPGFNVLDRDSVQGP
jgi:hypothetical protein